MKRDADAVVVFTGRTVERMLEERGSSAWALDRHHALRCEYVICCRNSRAEFTRPGPEAHGSAFLIARIKDVVPAPGEEHRFLIEFGEYAVIDVPDLWKGWRNPVRYASLAELGIDPTTLQFSPMPDAGGASATTERVEGTPRRKGLTIADAKRGLAETFGVSPDSIEITIRG